MTSNLIASSLEITKTKHCFSLDLLETWKLCLFPVDFDNLHGHSVIGARVIGSYGQLLECT